MNRRTEASRDFWVRWAATLPEWVTAGQETTDHWTMYCAGGEL